MELRDFILKTLLPYKEDRNNCAVVMGVDRVKGCVYRDSQDKRCAVGKWMKDGEWLDSDETIINLLEDYDLEDINTILKEEAASQDLSVDQWALIQAYHDLRAKNLKFATNESVIQIEKEFNIQLPELRL